MLKFRDLYYSNEAWDSGSMLKIYIPDVGVIFMEAKEAYINYEEYVVDWFNGNNVALEGVIDD